MAKIGILCFCVKLRYSCPNSGNFAELFYGSGQKLPVSVQVSVKFSDFTKLPYYVKFWRLVNLAIL